MVVAGSITVRKIPLLCMLLKISAVACAALFILGCPRNPSPSGSKEDLTGTWQFTVRSDCEGLGISQDRLILHVGGQLEQHVRFQNGKSYDSVNEHWSFDPPQKVELNRILLPVAMQPVGFAYQDKLRAVLSVQFSNPPEIVVAPGNNCRYVRVSQTAGE